MISVIYLAKKRTVAWEKEIQSKAENKLEFICLDPSSFAKSYNEALKIAKHDIALFLRKDVTILSSQFDLKLMSHFENSPYVALGTLGSLTVPKTAFIWEVSDQLVGKISYKTKKEESVHQFSALFEERIIPVLALHDSFFAVNRKKIKTRFDENYVSDSFYDIDFFLANRAAGVVFDIEILRAAEERQDKFFEPSRAYFISQHPDLPLREKPSLIHSEKGISIKMPPHVTVVVTAENDPTEVMSTIDSIEKHTKYERYDVIVATSALAEEEIHEIKAHVAHYANVCIVSYPHTHIPSLLGDVVEHHVPGTVQLILFMKQGVLFVNDVLSRMVKAYQHFKTGCGVVGARIHGFNHMVRHMGLQLVTTEKGGEYELGLGYSGFNSAYNYTTDIKENVVGVSRECLMISRKLFRHLGGFQGKYLHSLEDFDLGIRAILEGKVNVVAGDAVCMHLGIDQPKFHPDDFMHLLELINAHIETVTPFVDLYA
ncbi:MAG: hypothetical protein A3F09_04695 [Chlamydiae bacterium RIFCSPHIGHO2_12_FULL_49_11]|nr:MAG: hypothetical protein A3F09_04695 [Chlamydiae bacterium RIFCSPHIGHO2_12_FULL_49_11]